MAIDTPGVRISRNMSLFLSLALPILVFASLQSIIASSLSQQARRILEEKCVGCHGPTRMSGLDLRDREAMLTGGTRGPALIPGDAGMSLVYQAVAHLGDLKMPPNQDPLAAVDVETLKRWIEAGAVWDSELSREDAGGSWWSFRKPELSPVCWRPCKSAGNWPSKMSGLGSVTERWLERGIRVFQTVRGGFHILVSSPNGGDAMIARETRVLLRHYLEQGVSKAAVARKLGISERTVYRWIAAGQLDRDLGDGTDRYGPRRPRTSMLDPYKRIIDTRLAEYPELSAVRLFQEVRAAGYPGGYGQVKRYVRQVRPRPAAEPVQRFETPPGHQGQVDFAQFRLPWGQRHALIVVLGYSRLMWLQYYERQTMAVLMRGLESAFHFFQGVPSELLFDQMKAVIIEDGRETGGRLVENPEFIRFGAHWGFRIRACRPYRAQTKGKVERPIRYLRNNFFYGRDFGSDDDLNAQVLRWLDREANVRIHGTLKQCPVDRFEVERPHLMPLVPWPYRPVVPRSQDSASERNPEGTFPPVVQVQRRPLADYARISGGVS